MSSDERTAASSPPRAGRPEPGRPGSVRVLWIVFIAVLALTVAAELLVHLHPRFSLERWFGFHAAWGFLSCVAMVLFANFLGIFLRRPDDYYLQRPEWPDDGKRSDD